jgi:HMG (high mobility group) box
MAPTSSDQRGRVIGAVTQLRQALVLASEALSTLAETVPILLTSEQNTTAPHLTTSATLGVNQHESAAVPTSNKRKRKEKDPDAPEKPPSAYHLYAKEKRDEIKSAMSGQPTAYDVIHEINRVWKGLAEEVKKVNTPRGIYC